MLRHSDEFIERRVLFAGDLQDSLPAQFEAADVRVHTQQYHHWQLLNRTMGDNVQFGLTVDPARRQLRHAGLLLAEEQAGSAIPAVQHHGAAAGGRRRVRGR